MTRVAVGQLTAERGEVARNLDRCARAQERAGAEGVELLVLPEAVLTGYVFDVASDVRRAAVSADGVEIMTLATIAERLAVTTVVGFLESDDDAIFNSCALLTADGAVHVYRKAHLPWLGADRFVEAGDRIGPVVDTPAGCVGLAICYDVRFPEVIRSLALAGADIVALPVSWPTSASMLAEQFVPVRAAENRVFVAMANRPDREGDIQFRGGSAIVNPDGEIAAAVGAGTDDLAIADVDLDHARNKVRVFQPGTYEIDVFGGRRPELYGAVSSPNAGQPTTRERAAVRSNRRRGE